jgi:cobalt-zinc-cadmium efflux system membrane fusion protein
MRCIALALAGISVLVAAGCGSKPESTDAGSREPAAEKPPTAKSSSAATVQIDSEMLRDLRITTTKAESRAGGEAVNLQGELRIDESRYAQVGTPIAARALRVLAGPGDSVRAGQVLVELQSPELGRSRADLLTANSRVELARQVLARKRELAAERIVPEREVQEAESQLAVAGAEAQSANAALRALGAAGDDGADPSSFSLRAPIAGTIVDRAVAVGQMIDPSKPAFEIAELSTLWLVVHAFEREAVRVKVGAAARVTLPAMPGRTFTGTVRLVGRRVDVDSRTVPVRLDMPNPDQTLRPGMAGVAAIVLSETAGRIIAVPVAALQRMADRWVVFIPKDTSTFEVRTVGRGRDLGGEVEILTGLRQDETVVVEGSFLLKAEADKARGEGEHEH